MGASNEELIDVYCKQVQNVLELAVAVWPPGLTVSQIKQIERVQKTVCCIILGGKYSDYTDALSTLTITKLREWTYFLILPKNLIKVTNIRTGLYQEQMILITSKPEVTNPALLRWLLEPNDTRTLHYQVLQHY